MHPGTKIIPRIYNVPLFPKCSLGLDGILISDRPCDPRQECRQGENSPKGTPRVGFWYSHSTDGNVETRGISWFARGDREVGQEPWITGGVGRDTSEMPEQLSETQGLPANALNEHHSSPAFCAAPRRRKVARGCSSCFPPPGSSSKAREPP